MKARFLVLAFCVGIIPQNSFSQDWVLRDFAAAGSPYNANNHSIPQGAGINTPGVQAPAGAQMQMYIPGTNMPFQNQTSRQPQQQQTYQYNVPQVPQQNQQVLRLNPNLRNDIVTMRPIPPAPVYRAPPPPTVYYSAPVTGFRRTR